MSTPAPLGSTVLRTNLCADPSGAGGSGSTAWTLSAGTTWLASGGNLNPACWQIVGSAVSSGTNYLSTASAHSIPVTAGQVVTISCSAKRGVGSSNLRLFAESTYGSTIVSGSDVTRTLTGAYARYSTTFTVPGGVTQVWLFAAINCLVINNSIFVGDFLVEVAPAAGSYFDGDTLNATWSGTVHNSASTLYVLSQNPNLPVLEFAAWPGVNPTMVGVPTSQPTVLTDRARSFKISRGRQYELAQDQAATGSVTLNNFDGQVTGGVNGCTPITSCQLTAKWAGVTYPVWTGQIRSWPQQDDSPAVAWADAELTDTFEALSNHPFGPLVYEEIKERTVPDAWFPMNEAASSQSIGNLVPGGVSAPLVSFKRGGVPFALGATSVFAGTSETVLSLANSTGTTNLASQYQMIGPQNPGSGYSMPFGAPWGVGLFVRMTAGASVVWSALDTDGTVMAALLVDAGTPQIIGYTRQGGPGATYFGSPVPTSAMKLGCYVHFGHDGTQAFCYVYGVTADGTLYAAAGGGNCTNVTGTSQWVAWGQSFNSSGIYYSSNADMQLCHGTIWTTSPPTPYTNPIIAIASTGLNATYSYKSRDQMAYLSAYAGAAVTGDAADGQVLGQIRDTNKSSALDSVRAVVLDYLGRVLMDRSGLLQWQSVHHQMGAPTKWTLGGNTGAGELPYTGAPRFDFDPTYVYNDVQVQRPDTRGVAQQTTSTKAMVRVTDTASAASYFTRVLQIDSNVKADADALAVAQYLLNRYRQPKTRVRTVKFDPSANPALWPFVLGAELGDTVTLNHRAIGRATISLSLSIQQITHEVDAVGGTWITSMELAPWSSDWALGAMHTTVKATVASGVSSITLNPLPDAATNPAELSLAAGTTITLSPGTANAETMTILSVVSTPTALTTGYTGITVTFTATTAHGHTVGDVACDPLPAGVTDPTTWDAFSTLDSTTVLSI